MATHAWRKFLVCNAVSVLLMDYVTLSVDFFLIFCNTPAGAAILLYFPVKFGCYVSCKCLVADVSSLTVRLNPL